MFRRWRMDSTHKGGARTLLRQRKLHPAVTNLTVEPNVQLQVLTCWEEAQVNATGVM